MPPEELNALFEAYVPGTGGMDAERLGSGLVNDSYRVKRDGVEYAVRVPSSDAAALGVGWAFECRVLRRAGELGFAPAVEHCVAERGILVSRWVPGGHWSREQALRDDNLARMARLVHRIHALRIAAPERCMTPADWIERYSRVLGPHFASTTGIPSASARERLSMLAGLPGAASTVCHSDLHLANVVVAGPGLVLLDWEYAHISDPLWDLAGWICNIDMPPPARNVFLQAYLQRPAAPDELRRLWLMQWLYDYVCVLWSAVYLRSGRDAGQADSVRARARALTRRLELDPGGPSG